MFRHLAVSALASVGLACLAPSGFSQGALQSTGLGEIDPWGIGAISRAEGALPVTLWQGSEAEILRPLLTRINVRGLTPVTRDLLTRTLLSPSRAPTGEGSDELMAERMRLIWELGRSLFAVAPKVFSIQRLATVAFSSKAYFATTISVDSTSWSSSPLGSSIRI